MAALGTCARAVARRDTCNGVRTQSHRATRSTSRPFSISTLVRQAKCLDALSSSVQVHEDLRLPSDDLRSQARAALAARDRIATPPSPFLTDRFSRQHTYLRISLTEKCNFRCLYCMPAEGVPLTAKEHLLTAAEVERLARLFVQQGVNKIRLTGGEPTVRKDLSDVISGLSTLRAHGLRQIGITTNGLTLPRQLPALVASGLTHLNVSLDTLDPFKFELMTRTPAKGIDRVLQGIDAALALGVPNVKVNVVVIRGLNDGKDVLDFVEWAQDRNVVVRFIEYMPFDGNRWRPEKLVPYSQLLERITERFGALEKVADDTNDTSKHWRVAGHKSSLGFITSMTEHFCGTCNRLRITADGNLKVCLFGNAEVSLRDAMRHGLPGVSDGPASDHELLQIIGAAVKRKHAKHAGMADPVELAQGPGLQRRSAHRVKRLDHLFSMNPAKAHHIRAYSTSKGSGPWDDLDAVADAAMCGIETPNESKTDRGLPSWSEYMGTQGDDSPWASLDAFADGYQEKANSPVPSVATASPALSSTPSGWEMAAKAAAETFAAGRSRNLTRDPAVEQAPRLTHLDAKDNSRAAMVDVSDKATSKRTATAKCRVHIPEQALILLNQSSSASDPEASTGSARLKGPVLHTAQLAGIMAAKRTSDMIPLCHGLNLSHVDVSLEVIRSSTSLTGGLESKLGDGENNVGFTPGQLEDWDAESSQLREPGQISQPTEKTAVEAESREHYISVTCTATTTSATGVEMEALTGASVASLTLWDMLKSVGGREMRIDGLMVTRKTGGKSGDFERST